MCPKITNNIHQISGIYMRISHWMFQRNIQKHTIQKEENFDNYGHF